MSEQPEEISSQGVRVEENPILKELDLAEPLIASDRRLSQTIQNEMEKEAEDAARGSIDYTSITLLVTALVSSVVVLVSIGVAFVLVMVVAVCSYRSRRAATTKPSTSSTDGKETALDEPAEDSQVRERMTRSLRIEQHTATMKIEVGGEVVHSPIRISRMVEVSVDQSS